MPTVISAIDGGSDILVGQYPVLVGRHPICDMRLESFRVSRRHCTLVEVDGAVVVRDLGSTNGTWINGRRIKSGWLYAGDEFGIAEIRYRVNADLESPVSTRTSPASETFSGRVSEI